MRFNPLVATVTVAVCAVALVGACIFQAVKQGKPDGELMGLAGLLLGAFLRSPAGVDTVTVDQPANRPVPVTDDRGQGGLDLLIKVCVAVVVVVLCIWILSELFARI